MTGAGSGQGEPAQVAPSSRHRRRGLLVLVPIVALAVLYAAVTAAAGEPRSDGDTGPTVATDTAAISSRTLSQKLTLDGALTFAGSSELVGARAGTVTALPDIGAKVTAGRPVWSIDNVPVPLMIGALPQWRPFEPSMANGQDVKQLEENLRRLGHDPSKRMAVDTDFTTATSNAIRRWQKATGQQQTGAIALGEIVFYPTDLRVTERLAAIGSQVAPGAPMLKVSQTRRVVTVKLDARRQGLVRAGSAVQVELPDGRSVPGKVAVIGSVATQEGDSPPTVDVSIDFDAAADLPDLDQAPVDVLVNTQSKTALAVPVKALLALAEGGYAVEVVEGDRRRLVAVETGMFADGYVEITGSSVRDGMKVTVPQ